MNDDAFAPLAPAASARSSRDSGAEESRASTIVMPIPADAPPPPPHRLGAPTATWRYRNADGALLCLVHRFDNRGEKQFRPQTLWRTAAGVYEWRWESCPAPRPLYGLDQLAARPDALVIVVEGERACDAGRRLLPGCVVVTSPNGSKSASKADLSPLVGRKVVIWPDADAAGRAYAHAIAALLKPIAASVRIATPTDGVAEGWDAADAERDGWDEARAARFIDAAVAPDDGGGVGSADGASSIGAPGRRQTRSDALMAALAGLDLWHDADHAAYASIELAGHVEHWPLKSAAFKRWLANLSRLQTGQVLSGSTLDDVVRTIEAIAINERPRHTPFLRAARLDGRIYLDLCDDGWRSVEVDAQGWRVVGRPPVKFVRTPAMRALPEPIADEGGIEALRALLNVKSDADFKLVVAFLVMAFRGIGPFPVLVVNGEQGTGKSFFTRMIRSLVDPSAAPIRAAPKDDRDLIVSAMNSFVLAFDNLSGVANWFSDSICRIATGGGFATRQLHTDRDEMITEVQRPVILNGIPSLTDRADLADRALNIQLCVIPAERRVEEESLWHEYETQRPVILGALLDAVSAALRNLPNVKLDRLPRMADFLKWVTAAESGLGWESGDFATVYNRNRAEIAEGAFEADAVAVAIRDMMNANGETWTGTPTELLNLLGARVSDAVKRSRAWPMTAQGLGNRLERASPLLRAQGFIVERKHSEKRLITIVAPRGEVPM